MYIHVLADIYSQTYEAARDTKTYRDCSERKGLHHSDSRRCVFADRSVNSALAHPVVEEAGVHNSTDSPHNI